MTPKEVTDHLNTATMEDINNLRYLMNLRVRQLGLQVGSAFKPGDAVSFDTKTRGTVHGKFVKLKQKNAEVVSDAGVRWTVAPQLLRAKV